MYELLLAQAHNVHTRARLGGQPEALLAYGVGRPMPRVRLGAAHLAAAVQHLRDLYPPDSGHGKQGRCLYLHGHASLFFAAMTAPPVLSNSRMG